MRFLSSVVRSFCTPGFRRYNALVMVFFFSVSPTLAQNNQFKDSLLQQISQAEEDSNKVKYFQSLGGSYYQTNADSFFLYTHHGLALAKKIEWDKGIANCSNNIGLLLSDTGNHMLAIKYLEESLVINRKINAKLNIINNLTNIGRIYYRQSDFVKSSHYFFDALKIAEEINDHEKIAMIGTNLTATFCSQKDWEKGEKYALLTLKHSELANAPIHTFKSFIALGDIRAERFDTLNAKNYFEKALELCKANDFKLLSAEALNNLALLEKNNSSALTLALEVRRIYDELSPHSLNSVMNLQALGVLYLNLFQSTNQKVQQDEYLKKAEYYLKEKIKTCTELKYAEALASGLHQLVRVMEMKGNYQLAYQYNKQYHAITDSIYSQENKNKIATIEGQREVAVRDKEIALNKQELLVQRNQLIALIGGVILLLIIGMLLYRQNKIRKSTNTRLLQLNIELAAANKVKAKFFGIVSHDLRGPIARLVNFVRLQNEAPDLLSKEQVADHQKKIINSAETLLDNMDDILLWSKGQMENFKPAMKSIAVSDLFNRLEQSFSNNDSIIFSFSNAETLLIFTDENFVFTILENLTANAAKALNTTSEAKIEWTAMQKDNEIILSISDNGPGLKDSSVDNLLNKSEISSEVNGFGFHIIRDLASAIQCKISAVSLSGKGTTFQLYFPINRN